MSDDPVQADSYGHARVDRSVDEIDRIYEREQFELKWHSIVLSVAI